MTRPSEEVPSPATGQGLVSGRAGPWPSCSRGPSRPLPAVQGDSQSRAAPCGGARGLLLRSSICNGKWNLSLCRTSRNRWVPTRRPPAVAHVGGAEAEGSLRGGSRRWAGARSGTRAALPPVAPVGPAVPAAATRWHCCSSLQPGGCVGRAGPVEDGQRPREPLGRRLLRRGGGARAAGPGLRAPGSGSPSFRNQPQFPRLYRGRLGVVRSFCFCPRL